MRRVKPLMVVVAVTLAVGSAGVAYVFSQGQPTEVGSPAQGGPKQPFPIKQPSHEGAGGLMGPGVPPQQQQPDEVLVRFAPWVSATQIKVINQKVGVQVDRVVPILKEKLYVVKVPAGKTTDEIVRSYSGFKEVEVAEANFTYRPF